MASSSHPCSGFRLQTPSVCRQVVQSFFCTELHMHSALVVEQDSTSRRGTSVANSTIRALHSNVRIIEKVKQEGQNMPHLANGNHRISLTQGKKGASEGRRQWTHKHLVTYRTHTDPRLSVSHTHRSVLGTETGPTEVNQRIRSWNPTNGAGVNEQIVTFHALHTGNNYFTRQAINIVVITIITIIHAQLIHIHSRQNNTAHARVSAQAYKHIPLQTHLPLHHGMYLIV